MSLRVVLSSWLTTPSAYCNPLKTGDAFHWADDWLMRLAKIRTVPYMYTGLPPLELGRTANSLKRTNAYLLVRARWWRQRENRLIVWQTRKKGLWLPSFPKFDWPMKENIVITCSSWIWTIPFEFIPWFPNVYHTAKSIAVHITVDVIHEQVTVTTVVHRHSALPTP